MTSSNDFSHDVRRTRPGLAAVTAIMTTLSKRQTLLVQSAIATMTAIVCLLFAALALLASLRSGVFQTAEGVNTSPVNALSSAPTATPTFTPVPTATPTATLTPIPHRALTLTATHGPQAVFPTPESPAPTPLFTGPIQMFPYKVIDARYSLALDRIIIISDNPNQLHIFDPLTQADVTVDLGREPAYLTLSPDGLFAAVAHDALVSYVDLQTPARLKEIAFSAVPADIVLPGNGWVYISPALNDLNPVLHAVEIETGTEYTIETEDVTVRAGANFEAPPSGQWLYGAGSSTGIRMDLNGGFPTFTGEINDVMDAHSGLCGSFWISDNGRYIFTRCGIVFSSAMEIDRDMQYVGELAEDPDSLVWVTPVDTTGRVLAVEERSNLLKVWAVPSYRLVETIILPDFEMNERNMESFARYVFANRAGTSYFAILQMIDDSYKPSDYCGLVSAPIP